MHLTITRRQSYAHTEYEYNRVRILSILVVLVRKSNFRELAPVLVVYLLARASHIEVFKFYVFQP